MADTVIGVSLQADDQASQKVKSLKQQLREAQHEVVMLSQKFGDTSKEAAAAAKKAAELKDRISDAKSLVDAFNPDTKFRAFGASISTVVGGFSALTGSMALLGVESEETQKTLVKVQSALAISQGVAQLQEGIQSFRNLGSVLRGLGSPLQLAVAGVGAIGAAVAAWALSTDNQTAAQKALNDTMDDYKKAAAGAIEKVEQVRAQFSLAERGVISKDVALKAYNDTLGDSLGKTDNLRDAEKNLTDKADVYIKITALKAQANALFAKSAEMGADALIRQSKIGTVKKQDFTGGYITQQVQAEIEQAKQDAKDVENLGGELLLQVAELSKQFKIVTGGSSGDKTKTPKVKAAQEEGRDLAKIDEDRLARTETTNQRLAILNENLSDKIKVSNKGLADDYVKNLAVQRQAGEAQAVYEAQLAESRINTAKSIGSALGALSDLVGKQTAAGKVLAIAEATINTYLAASNILKNTARNPATGAIPGFAVFQMVATIAAGLATVRNIIKTPVPGASGGSSPSAISVGAPLQPQAPSQTSTRLDQQQLNQLGNATVRAYVTETDMANNSERTRRLNRAARIG